ncbi:polyprotein [Cirsium virus A]|nr:polyprotein [Cirsium virus A]
MILAILFLAISTILILEFEWERCIKPIYKIHLENRHLQLSSENRIRGNLDFEYFTTWRDKFWRVVAVYYNFPQERRRVSVFSPTKTLAELEMDQRSANISPVHTMPADVLLKRAGDYKMAKEGKQTMLPKVKDLYEMSAWQRAYSKLKQGAPTFVETSEMVVGEIKGGNVMRMQVPIVKTFEEQSADTRLPERVRAKGDQIMVAAVELISDGFASVNSDVTMAGALYDKRHMKLENSFKGAYGSRAGGAPSHVVFYPNHRVPGADNPNETLELSAVSRDTDFSEEFTLAQVTARTVYAKAKGPESIHETRQLLKKQVEDVVLAKQFADEGSVVLAHPRLYPKVNLDNYELPRASSILQTKGIYQAGSIRFPKPQFKGEGIVLNHTGSVSQYAPRNEDLHDESDDEDRWKGQGLTEGYGLMEGHLKEVETNMRPLTGISETERLLYSGSSIIQLNVTEGSKVMSFWLNDLKKNRQGVHMPLLNMLGKVPGCIRMRIHCNLSPTCGIGLAVSYVEGNESAKLGNDLGRILGINHYKWNPAMEKSVEFCFKPFSCSDWWSPHHLGTEKFAPAITTICLSGWLNPPKLESRIAWALYFEPEMILPKQIATLHDVPSFMLRKEIGTIRFKQGERKAHAFEANIGKSQVNGKIVTHTFASAYCGLSQYISGDVILDFTLMSSPMYGATFSVAYVAGDGKIFATNMQLLDGLPHANFAFQGGGKSTESIRFKKEIFGPLQALDRWDMDHSNDQEVSGRFVVYQRDSVSSSLEGDMVMRVAMRVGGELEFHGISSGYPTTTTRIGKGKAAPRNYGLEPRLPIGRFRGQARLFEEDLSKITWPFAFWQYVASEHQGSQAEGQISSVYLKTRLDGTKPSKGFEIAHSALTRLLQNCAWFSGTIEWEITVLANSEIEAARRTSQTKITIHESGISSNESNVAVLNGPSGQVIMQRTTVGTVDGFRSMGWHVAGEKKFYKLCVQLGNVHEYKSVYVAARLHPNVRFAGQQKGGTYTLSKEASVFKEIPY